MLFRRDHPGTASCLVPFLSLHLLRRPACPLPVKTKREPGPTLVMPGRRSGPDDRKKNQARKAISHQSWKAVTHPTGVSVHGERWRLIPVPRCRFGSQERASRPNAALLPATGESLIDSPVADRTFTPCLNLSISLLTGRFFPHSLLEHVSPGGVLKRPVFSLVRSQLRWRRFRA